MLLGAEFKVRTPWGVFALVAARSSRGWVGAERRVLSPQEAQRVWFFAEGSLERPGGFELAAVRELLREVNGDWLVFRGTTRDALQLERLREAVGQALRAGRLRFEEVPLNPEPDRRRRTVRLPEPPARAPAPREGPAPKPAPTTWFEVEVVDELGEAVTDLEVDFDIAGERRAVTTDGGGRARVDLPSTASAATVRFASTAALRVRLYERWEQCRGSPWIETQPDDAVLPVRASEPLPEVSLRPERRRRIVLVPRVVLARLLGVWFDVSKCFLLPTARTTLPLLQGLYDKCPDSHLLVVGHTDRAGKPTYNDPLSVERARSILAYLKNDVAAWYAWYGDGKPAEKRWGAHEDRLMITALGCPDGSEPVRWFQSRHSASGMKLDGIAGPQTRQQLIADYMELDRTTLPDSIAADVHGCGENFPLVETEDGEREQANRRVELFFFDSPVLPPAPGLNSPPGSRQYPEWTLRAKETYDFDPDGLFTIDIRLHDANKVPLTAVPYRATAGGMVVAEGTAGDGWLHLRLPSSGASVVDCEWGAPLSDGSFPFRRSIRLDHDVGSERDQAGARLHNLGYGVASDAEYEAAVRAFQEEYRIPESGLVGGELPALTKSKLWLIFETDCDASSEPSTAAAAPGATPEE